MNPSAEELLFSAALGFEDLKERSAFLDVACHGDLTLRSHLADMLAVEEEAATFFEFQPEVQGNDGAADARGDEGVGARVGRYRLVTRIGAGGCGVVYCAQQEEPVQRKVALKIVKLGMDTEAVIRRFELERQALAQMDHPYIARVLDAGATPSGRPYFVMEIVDGEKITDFCDTNRFHIRQRLDLFIQVCRAIQHAHQKGLIHRDIKPSNVLVHSQEGAPVPKVIDFGIAKATAASLSAGAAFTHFDQFLGTPAYMSPEQAQGSADVDTRSDIYSLGVLLYELLCGRPPFNLERLTDSTMDEARRIIREEEPKRPSAMFKTEEPERRAALVINRGGDAQHLAAQLAGDLDWIVVKAMEKDRSRRYDTANGLAMDVQRYLNDEAVQARPPSRVYRLGKLVRRNKLIFTAASIAVFGLVVGLGTSTWLYFRERAAKLEQVRLLGKAELRERIALAAVKIKYGDLQGADTLLAEVPAEQTPSSLEAANAFGTVADWHVKAGRLKEAAVRFRSMIKALATVDKSDIPSVSFDLLPVAATVAYAETPARYEEIRQMGIARFSGTSNPVVAEQTLKACMLLPAAKETLRSVSPLATVLERAIKSKQGWTAKDPVHMAWANFAMALWCYRAGDLANAVQWLDACLADPEQNEARRVTAQIIRAMIEQRSGHPVEAYSILKQPRESVGNAISGGLWINPQPPAYWFDWINAAILLNEANHLIDNS